MNIQVLFGLSVFMSFGAFGLVTHLYIRPRFRILERDDALIPLVVPHTFRFIEFSFLVPWVVSPSLPSALAGCGISPVAEGERERLLVKGRTNHRLYGGTMYLRQMWQTDRRHWQSEPVKIVRSKECNPRRYQPGSSTKVWPVIGW
jgi:hypothetical protein